MIPVIYTLGYAHHTQESFLELLKKYEISCVIDVRTMAYSRFHPQFNKEPLKVFLKMNGIIYMHMYKEFGIIRGEEELKNRQGYLDFEKIANLPIFKEGIIRVERGMAKGFHICFICAEKDPMDCHRSTLVAKAFREKGYEVRHIKSDGSVESQERLEKRILEKYYPDNGQMNLFGEGERVRLKKAYEVCNNGIVEVNSKRVLKEEYVSPKKTNGLLK